MSKRLKRLERKLAACNTYADWLELAKAHDKERGADNWKSEPASPHYDCLAIRERRDLLARLLRERNHHELLFALNEGLHGNLEGIGNRELYRQSMIGTKYLIDDYIDLVRRALLEIGSCSHRKIPKAAKIEFFHRANRCYGRSALMLSGGAGLVYFHHGVVQTLLEHDLLPDITSGSSAGSWICAQLASKTSSELKDGYFFKQTYDIPRNKSPWKVLLGRDPGYKPSDFLSQTLDQFLDDLTFGEAFEKTGRQINISVAPAEKHQVSRLLSPITTPNVYIRSAVQASSSLPGMVPPVRLYAKGSDGRPRPYLKSRRWRDGSFADDLPAKRLARVYGVNHFIVSMINPIAIPFIDGRSLHPKFSWQHSSSEVMARGIHSLIYSLGQVSSRLGLQAVSPALLAAEALLDQKYTGDINIVLEKAKYDLRDILFSYADGDATVQQLKLAGARSTWPKLARIRNSTIIGSTIAGVLADLDEIRH